MSTTDDTTEIESQPPKQEVPVEDGNLRDDVRGLAGGTAATAAGTLTGRLVHLATDIGLARLLGPGGFGIYSIAWNFHRLIAIFLALGIPNGIVFFGVKHWKKDSARLRAVFEAGMIGLLIMGGLTALTIWLTADWLAITVFNKPEASQAIRTAGFIMPFMLVMQGASALTRVTRRMQYSIISNELVSTVSMLVAFALLYWLTRQFWAVFVALIISYLLASGAALFFAYKLFPELRQKSEIPWPHMLRELLGFSVPTMLAGAVGSINFMFNRLLAGALFPADQVGLYQAASQFNSLFATLLGSIAIAFMPVIAKLHQTDQKARLNELYKVTTKWSLYMSLPVIIIALSLPRDVMRFFYGAEYTPGAWLLVILTIGQLVNVSTGVTSGLFVMTGRQREWLSLTVVTFCVSIFATFMLVPSLGIHAVAVGSMLISLFNNLFGTFWLMRSTKLWPYDARYFKGLLAALAAVISLWLTSGLPPDQTLIFALRSGFSLIVFVGVLWLLGLDHEDHEFLSVLFGRVRRTFSSPRA